MTPHLMARYQHDAGSQDGQSQPSPSSSPKSKTVRFLFNAGRRKSRVDSSLSLSSDGTLEGGKSKQKKERSTLGILADRETDEVPGTVILLSNSVRNEPLGEEKMEHHKDEAASIRSKRSSVHVVTDAKRTADGKIVLNPQPEDTPNDPLNWPIWRRNCALLCLGYYCMLGGGMTPVLAAGFNQVATTYGVSYSQVALTTGLYMMGLGVGSVIFSPTAILFGKRPVYLGSSILFVLSSVWCALAPSYTHLVVARVVQGIAVSPVECLPSATIAEIFFLHERAFRVGIYTLLLLGGKNLIPLVSAAIIQSKGWRWVFWIVAIVVGFGGVLLFFFNPETFWDRTPRPRRLTRASGSNLSLHSKIGRSLRPSTSRSQSVPTISTNNDHGQGSFTAASDGLTLDTQNVDQNLVSPSSAMKNTSAKNLKATNVHFDNASNEANHQKTSSPNLSELERANNHLPAQVDNAVHDTMQIPRSMLETPISRIKSTASTEPDVPNSAIEPKGFDIERRDPNMVRYTTGLRNSPPVPYIQTLQPWNGRLSQANWLLVAFRPFVLFAYPSVLWSAMVYALSVGWLIVLSESVAHVYEARDTYNFTSIQVGLVYISPFVGGVLGTAVAGRCSDIIVRFMSRRNGGMYEPEFRLVMGIPIAFATAIGLMGFGWSIEEKDNFMVPTIFFGIISFGCCIGSTTAITFCVDSYRQFAAEALVTLNFSKNILHGLIWSLFFPQWLESSGPKDVFLVIGGIQLACMLFTIPMYVFGKRARMWTVRMKMMERF